VLLQLWVLGLGSAGGLGLGGEVEELEWFGQVKGLPDGVLVGGGRGMLCDPAIGGGEGDQVYPVEFVADAAPGVAGGGLGDPDEQPCQPDGRPVGGAAPISNRSRSRCSTYAPDQGKRS
jgi:hypothetical protein